MNKEEKIKILNVQIDKFLKLPIDDSLIVETSEIVKRFLGEDSEHYKALSKIKITPINTLNFSFPLMVKSHDEIKNISGIIKSAISLIDNNDLSYERHSKERYWFQKDTGYGNLKWLIHLIFSAIGFIIGFVVRYIWGC